MRSGRGRLIGAAGLIICGGLAVSQCTSMPAPGPAAAAPADLKPYVTIQELMEDVIDPIADNIFDAVVTDVTAKGVVETRPVTDQDWAKVRQGAVTLIESTTLLKMPRMVAPPGDKNNSEGPNAPELSPDEIQARIDRDRALWNKLADELRDEAVKVLEIVKAKNADALFDAGSRLDKACENCHLEYWYPGDKKFVLEDEAKRVTIEQPKK